MSSSPSPLAPLAHVAGPGDTGDQGPILDGALAAFLDVGVRRTSMGDVARRARISPATLYRKFASKSGLVEAVAMREARRLLAEVDRGLLEAQHRGAPPEDQVFALAMAVIDGIRRNQLLRRLTQTEPELVLPLLTTAGGPVLAMGRDYVTGVLAHLQQQGHLQAYDPAPMAEVLARLALSLALTPETILPLEHEQASRALFDAHIVPALYPTSGAPS